MKPERAPTAETCLAPTASERIARIKGDLRMGLPCHVSSDTEQAVVVAVETLSQARLEALCGLFGTPYVVLSAPRAHSVLIQSLPNRPIRIAPPAFADISWYQRLADAGHDAVSAHKGPLDIVAHGDAALSALALDLVKLAQLIPSAVVFELPLIADLPNHLHMSHVDTAEAAAYFEASPALGVVSSAPLPIGAHDTGRLHVFRDPNGIHEHMAMEIGDPDRAQSVLCRLHSACFTGDVLGSLKCDCGPQLHAALMQMGEEGSGVLLYLNQEGRGIGLANKMRAYDLQAQGFDTVEANNRLGFEDDERDFRVASVMLRTLGFERIRLLTNNPAKVNTMRDHGTAVTERLPLRVGKNPYNQGYLATKALKSGHAL